MGVKSTKVVEQVRAVDFGEEGVDLEGLGVVVKTEPLLVKVGIATPEIIELLTLLFDLFSLKLHAEEFNGFLEVFHPVVAVSNVKADFVVNFAAVATFLETSFQLFFFLEEKSQGFLVVADSVESKGHVVVIIVIFGVFHSFREGAV